MLVGIGVVVSGEVIRHAAWREGGKKGKRDYNGGALYNSGRLTLLAPHGRPEVGFMSHQNVARLLVIHPRQAQAAWTRRPMRGARVAGGTNCQIQIQ